MRATRMVEDMKHFTALVHCHNLEASPPPPAPKYVPAMI
jgi:hypothetical protein